MTDTPNPDPLLSDHPWAVFLRARRAAIEWLATDQQEPDDRIARILSMDTEQVTLIRTTAQEVF
jgi:hypothetical protein